MGLECPGFFGRLSASRVQPLSCAPFVVRAADTIKTSFLGDFLTNRQQCLPVVPVFTAFGLGARRRAVNTLVVTARFGPPAARGDEIL